MIKTILLCILLLLSFTFIYALEKITDTEKGEETESVQEDTQPIQEQNKPNQDSPGLNHSQVITAPVISAILATTFIIEDALFVLTKWDDIEFWVERGTLFSIHIPLYAVSPLRGLAMTGISGGLFSAYKLNEDKDIDFFRNFFYTGIFQAGLYSTYNAYRLNREKADAGIYNNDWRHKTFVAHFSDSLGELGDYNEEWKSYSFLDLLISPFKPKNLLDPFVGVFSIAGIISPLIRRSHDAAPWTTGKIYAGTWETNPVAAISVMLAFFFAESCIVSITEESHFRGFLYEEIGSNYGHITGKIIDCIYFPAIHIPQEIFIMEYDPLDIGFSFLSRSILTFCMDNLYDRGGLERTVAAHFWIDFTLFFTQWLLVSGEPQEDISAILQLLPEIQFRIAL